MKAIIVTLPTIVVDGLKLDELTFELTGFLRSDELYIPGTTMRERTKIMGNLAGRPHAKRFLIQQDAIPVKWRPILPVFAADDTIKHGPRGYLGFPHLCWCKRFKRWYLDSRWLGWGFGKDCRLVRLVPELTFEAEFPSL